jgi:hypothetical protein
MKKLCFFIFVGNNQDLLNKIGILLNKELNIMAYNKEQTAYFDIK